MYSPHSKLREITGEYHRRSVFLDMAWGTVVSELAFRSDLFKAMLRKCFMTVTESHFENRGK
jgi:hypothetical protein